MICRDCKEDKNESDFYMIEGYLWRVCKKCFYKRQVNTEEKHQRILASKARYRKRKRKILREKGREYSQREKSKELKRKYRLFNKEKLNAISKKYWIEHKRELQDKRNFRYRTDPEYRKKRSEYYKRWRDRKKLETANSTSL